MALRARLPWPDDGRAVGDVGRTLPHAVRPAARRASRSSPTPIPRSCWRRCRRQTAAIIVEPLQGEGGVRPLQPEMAAAITRRAATTGALLIADEVQCGLGRTGVPFYSSTLGLQPDLMALGKALGGGVPVGAALFSERVADAAAFGDHGSTYGGNLLACRAALVFLEELTVRSAGARGARSARRSKRRCGASPRAIRRSSTFAAPA